MKTYYKLIKWVKLNNYHNRQYILPLTDSEIKDYLDNPNTISNEIIPISKGKYYLLKLLYFDNIREYWNDKKEYNF